MKKKAGVTIQTLMTIGIFLLRWRRCL